MIHDVFNEPPRSYPDTLCRQRTPHAFLQCPKKIREDLTDALRGNPAGRTEGGRDGTRETNPSLAAIVELFNYSSCMRLTRGRTLGIEVLVEHIGLRNTEPSFNLRYDGYGFGHGFGHGVIATVPS